LDDGVALKKRILSDIAGRQMQVSRGNLALFGMAFSPFGQESGGCSLRTH
jgi:hypothetical protein